MKTAISIPDALFEEAETVRRRLGVSRSEFYASAVAQHLHNVRRGGVREQLDRNHADDPSSIDEEIVRYQASILPADEWA